MSHLYSPHDETTPVYDPSPSQKTQEPAAPEQANPHMGASGFRYLEINLTKK